MPSSPGADRPDPVRTAITALLADREMDDRDALAEALSIVYDKLQALASDSMRGQRRDVFIETTMLANEAVVRFLTLCPRINDRRHLLALASRIMRQILVDHVRAKARAKRGAGRPAVPLDEVVLALESRSGEIEDVQEAIERLAALDERLALLVEFRFFLGLTMEEAAALLGLSKSTAEREWVTARSWLRKELTRDT